MVSAGDLIALYMGLELQSARPLRHRLAQARQPQVDRGGPQVLHPRRALVRAFCSTAPRSPMGYAGTTLFSGIILAVGDGRPSV